jgi:hypothetical protein
MPVPSIIEGRPMNHYVGIDVSLEASSGALWMATATSPARQDLQ